MRLTEAIERRCQAADLRAQAVELLRRADALSLPIELESTASGLHSDKVSCDERLLAGLAGEQVRARQRRSLYFPGDILGEPAWDILLDLFSLGQLGQGVTVTNASLAGNTAPTTGLRWLNILERRGMVTREQSHRDRRVTWARLTPQALTRMRSYFVNALPANDAR